MHPDFLLDHLTREQLDEWEAYDRIDPIGEWRAEFRAAKLESLITNMVRLIYRDPKKPDPPLTTALDFMPDFDVDNVERDPKVKRQSVEEQKAILLSWASGLKHSKKKKNG